jgi:DNA-binding winged helix-turn-helix (wHTH) protein/tetratricopeptide (TPR) repeat protein
MSLENYSDFLHNFSVSDVNGESKHFYQFKSFRLDVAERQLLNNGVSVPLMPKVFDVLVYLVERGGHLVEKDELLRTVWADSFVEEANIARIIHELRKILGEDKNSDKFIETVAKKGYRFVAEVTKVPFGDAETARRGDAVMDVEEKSSQPNLKPKHTTRIILFAVVLLSMISLISLLAFNRQPASPVNSNQPKSIAVLPLKPVNTDNRDLIYELGIAESLILKLGSVKGVTVRPLSAIRKYSDIEQDAMTAGKEQQVDYVLESNYQLVNGKILVTSQLFNVQTGAIEETLRSEKDSTDKFLMQDAIANDFGNILLTRFGKSVSNQTAKHYTNNEEAYRLYLRGMNLTDKRGTDVEFRQAVELFEQSVRLDPNYALAYVGLAYAHRSLSTWGGDTHEEYRLSKKAVEKALQLDENLAEAHTILGEIQDTYEWDLSAADKSYRRAVELDPNSPFVHRFYALHLMNLERFDEAIIEAKAAIDLDPNSMWNQRILGMVFHFARRYDEAITQFKRVVEMDDNGNSRDWLSMAFMQKGDYDQAFEWFLEAEKRRWYVSLDSDSWKTIYAKSGWHGVLRQQLERKKLEEKNGYFPYWDMATIYAELGEKDSAFIYLEKCRQNRQLYMLWLRIEPKLDPLRSDPRFEDLIRRVGLN